MAKRKKENEESSQENLGQDSDAADNFGLPEIDYKPLDRNEVVQEQPMEETPVQSEPEPEPQFEAPKYQETHEEIADFADEDEPSSKAPLFISLIIGLVLIGAGFLIYKYWYVPKAKAKQEQLAKEEADKKKQAEDARIAKEKEEADRQRQAAEAAAKVKPAVGTIETLSAPTRRYFVIVTSDIDDDLVMDFAQKLSAKGVSSKIIPASSKGKFCRLAIADFDSYREAQSSADAAKGDYGSALWVMRY
jgi:hypothetical protein